MWLTNKENGQANNSMVTQNPKNPVSADSSAKGDYPDDWQEAVYQKIRALKETYFTELNEMYQKITMKLQQYDSLPQQPKTEQFEKLRIFIQMLERIMHVLQISKSNILSVHKEKLSSFEKQILNMLQSTRPRKMQQGQMPGAMQSHQPQSQIPQSQQFHETGMNPQLQSGNVQCSSGYAVQGSHPQWQQQQQQPGPPVTLDSEMRQTKNLDPQVQCVLQSQNQLLQQQIGVSQIQRQVLQQQERMFHNHQLQLAHQLQTLQSSNAQAQFITLSHSQLLQQHIFVCQVHQQGLQQLEQMLQNLQRELAHQMKQPPLGEIQGHPRTLVNTNQSVSFPISSYQSLSAVLSQIDQVSSPQSRQENVLPPFAEVKPEVVEMIE